MDSYSSHDLDCCIEFSIGNLGMGRFCHSLGGSNMVAQQYFLDHLSPDFHMGLLLFYQSMYFINFDSSLVSQISQNIDFAHSL